MENVNSISSLVCEVHRYFSKLHNPLQVRSFTTYATSKELHYIFNRPDEIYTARLFNQNDRVRKTNKEIYEHIYIDIHTGLKTPVEECYNYIQCSQTQE